MSFVLRLTLLNFFDILYFDIYYSFVVDILGSLFVLLSSFLVFVCVLVNWNLYYRIKEFYLLLLFCLFLFIFIFFCNNLFIFYILFELLLLPFYWFIGSWGSRDRKVVAAYQFFFFTFFGSLFILLVIIIFFSTVCSCELDCLMNICDLSLGMKIILFNFLFLGFMIKIPMFPLHLWLPEAHVEASTVGSILLAGILLKLGLYGIVKYLVPIFSSLIISFWILIIILALLSMLYSCLMTLYQVDLKKLVAYSSISHMNLAVLGIFSYNYIGIGGGICLLISHGWVSSALFFLVGCLYERYRTRSLLYFGGIANLMPLFSIFFFFFNLANMGFPGSSNFLGEFFVFLSFAGCWIIQFLIMFSFFLTTVYSVWLFVRVCFGSIRLCFFRSYCDLTLREFGIIIYFFFLTYLYGVFPKLFMFFCEYVGIFMLNCGY